MLRDTHKTNHDFILLKNLIMNRTNYVNRTYTYTHYDHARYILINSMCSKITFHNILYGLTLCLYAHWSS